MRTFLMVASLVAGAFAQVEYDTKIIPAHVEYVRDTSGAVIDSVQVSDGIARDQIRVSSDHVLRPNDTLELIGKVNGKNIAHRYVVIRESTYPKSGVLKVVHYTQWIVSRGE